MDVWKDLQPLIRNKRLGFGPAMVFAEVWEMLHGQPGEISGVTTKELAGRLNRDRATILEHLKKLHQFYDLFDVRCRYTNGCFDLRVFRPAPAHATAKPDRQRLLPGLTEAAIIDPAADVLAEPTAAQGGGLEDAGQETQRSGSTGETQRLAALRIAPQQGRGENPTETADPWGKPHALDVAADRGENPTARQPAFSAGKQPVGKAPRPRGENPTASERGENPTAFSGPDAIYPRPPASLVPMKEEYYSSNGSKEPNEPKGSNAPDADAAAVAVLARQIDRQRAAQTGAPGTPGCGSRPLGVSNALVEAIQTRFDPKAEKASLVSEMRALVHDPDTADWLFGYAADLVIVHGLGNRPDAGEILTRMQRLLAELREFRELRRRLQQPQVPRGRVFNRRVLEIAQAYNVPTPRQLKTQREAERRRQRAH
jgi:hypothetical protein